MEAFTSIHASELDPETLHRTLAEYVEYEQLRVFRRLLLTRLALIAFAVWIVSWPIHLVPHAALWVALTIVALAAVLTSPTPPATPHRPPTHRPR